MKSLLIYIGSHESHTMIEIMRVSSDIELAAILELQQLNLRRNIGEDEAGREGFVTAEYSMEILKYMHQFQPSIIAKDGNVIAGYVIVTTKNVYGKHALLDSLFDCIDELAYNGEILKHANYILSGQVCVAKGYRGKGIAQKMYCFYKKSLSKDYQVLITDVAQDNPRSIKAHIKSGFTILKTIDYGGLFWDIVLWDWQY